MIARYYGPLIAFSYKVEYEFNYTGMDDRSIWRLPRGDSNGVPEHPTLHIMVSTKCMDNERILIIILITTPHRRLPFGNRRMFNHHLSLVANIAPSKFWLCRMVWKKKYTKMAGTQSRASGTILELLANELVPASVRN